MEYVMPMCILYDPGQVSPIAMPFSSAPYNNNYNSCTPTQKKELEHRHKAGTTLTVTG